VDLWHGVLKAYGTQGRIFEMLSKLSHMIKGGFGPNEITLQILMESLGQDPKLMIEVYHTIVENFKVEGNTLALAAIVNAFCAASQPIEALHWLSKIKQSNIEFPLSVYVSLIVMYSKLHDPTSMSKCFAAVVNCSQQLNAQQLKAIKKAFDSVTTSNEDLDNALGRPQFNTTNATASITSPVPESTVPKTLSTSPSLKSVFHLQSQPESHFSLLLSQINTNVEKFQK